MLLNELEPGTLFKLTPKTIAAIEAEGGGYGHPGRETFVLLMPNFGAEPARVQVYDARNICHFYPSTKGKYEVDVVGTTTGMSHVGLPSRDLLMTSCDPEVFFEDAAGNVVPGFSVMPSKSRPVKVDRNGFAGLFHEDGFQAEFSPAPRQCHEQVVSNMRSTIHNMVAHANGIKGEDYTPSNMFHYGTDLVNVPFKISDKSFVELPAELLATGTDKQVALGCDPSENVWGHSWFTHDNPRQFPFRMAGGHIHLGTAPVAAWLHKRAERIIKAMDVFCGVPSVALFAGIDDPRRRQFYGRAGEFRFQKHGLEYRTLSNVWLQHQALTHLTFNLARAAFRIGMMDWEKFFQFDEGAVRHIINEHDVPAAQQFIQDNAKLLIWALDKDGGYGWGAKGLQTIHSGAKKVFGKRLGIHKAWLDPKHIPGDPRFQAFVASSRVKAWPGYATTETPAAPAETPAVPPVWAVIDEDSAPGTFSRAAWNIVLNRTEAILANPGTNGADHATAATVLRSLNLGAVSRPGRTRRG
jgi:hypothetical protein